VALDKKDVALGSSPDIDEDVQPGSSSGKQDVDLESSTGATAAEDVDASSERDSDVDVEALRLELENKRVEARRKQEEIERLRAQNEQVWSTTRSFLADRERERQGQPSAEADDGFYKRWEERAGVDRELLTDLENRLSKRYEVMRHQQMQADLYRHDGDIIAEIEGIAKDDPVLSNYVEDIKKEAGTIPGENRLRMSAHDIARRAARLVKADHLDEYEERAHKTALAEAKKNRRIRGEASSVGALKLSTGEHIELPESMKLYLERLNANRSSGTPEITAQDLLEQLREDRKANAGNLPSLNLS